MNMDIIILVFFSFLFPLLYASTAHPCSITKCGKNEVPIRFPFNQQGKQPENCGYPGFNLGCKSQNMIYLKLPYSGEFFVRDINYLNQQLDLYDPDDCLPRRLLSFNLSGSPFVAVFHQNYTFLNCLIQVTKSRFTTIDCLSNSTHSVLATSSMRLAKSMASSSCRIIATLPIPVLWPAKYDEDFSAELDADIQLTWYTPQCGECETQGGTCGFKNNSNEEIECYHLPNSGRTDAGLRVFRIICLSIAVPALTCAVGIALFACCLDGRHRARENLTQRNNRSAVVLPQPTVVTGLDESTIESYEKAVLGESRRVPGPNDNTCPICLSEYLSKDTIRCISECKHCFHAECIDAWLQMNTYLSKDTIRCIPECKHCFHAECIDAWLQMNTTCPVCRNSPSPEHATSQTDIV